MLALRRCVLGFTIHFVCLYITFTRSVCSHGSLVFAHIIHLHLWSMQGSRLYIHGGLFANGSRSGDLFEWM